MKKWTYTIIQDNEGKISMVRENDGFNLYELIGFTEFLRHDLIGFLRGETRLDEIKRVATSTSPGGPDEVIEPK